MNSYQVTMSSGILQNGTSGLLGRSLNANSNGPSSPSECLYANINPFENKTKGDSDSSSEVLYENVHNLRRKPTGNPSSPILSQNIIYDVPKSNECIYSQPKSNASLSVDALIPQAAKLILAQTSSNGSNSIDHDRSDSESDGFDLDSVPSIPPADYDSFVSDDFLDAPYVDYGLQVIHEETESQMSSDSDQELDRCADFCSETIRQRKPKYDSESQHFGLPPDYSSASLQASATLSPVSEIHDPKNDKSLPEEIVLKHIRIPPDWDPTLMLQRLFTVYEPNSTNGCSSPGTAMEGHMQLLSGNRKKGTFWNAWKRKFCIASGGKLDCFDKSDCQDLFQSINLSGGKVDFLDPVDFVGKEQGKTMINRILGVDDGKGHYYVFQCSSVGEAARWIETLQQEMSATKTFATPSLPKNPSLFRDILLIDIGSTNIRAGILTHQPTLPALFFNAVMSDNMETGRTLYGNEVYNPDNRKQAKIRFPFESTSKMCQNTVDMKALQGFMLKIFKDLNIVPNNYRLILTLPRRVDNKCRRSILQLVFHDFQVRSALLCHQSVISFWAHSAENGIVCDIGERCDVVPVSQGFVLSHAWGRAPFGGHVLKHSLRQGLGPQENGLYLSTPAENLVLRFISENFVCVNNAPGPGGRKLSQDSQEIIVEMDLRDVLPLSSLIGVDQEVLRGVAEGFFEPGLYGLDCESIQKILYKSLQDCGVDIRKEMSQNIFLVGGSTLIPGFPERLQAEFTKLCPPHLKPKIQVSPFRYHASYIGASVLASTEAYEKSLLQRVAYDDGPGPTHWLI